MSDGAVWLNGAFVERDAARVSAFDAGFLHGVGLFETMLAHGRRVVRLSAHLERMAASAAALGLSERLRVDPLGEAVRRTVERAGLARARVRLTVTGGDLNMLASPAAGGTVGAARRDPTVLVAAQPATNYPAELFERGALVTIADMRANPLDPFEGHKTLNYWRRLRALQAAAGKGASEALVLQVSNHLAGGAVSNVLLVQDGRFLTPIARGEEEPGAIGSPVLPGITREMARGYAAEMGVEVEARMLSVADALDADEVMLTNSSWGVLPVTRIEGRTIGGGAVGEWTMRLRRMWLDEVESGGGDGA